MCYQTPILTLVIEMTEHRKMQLKVAHVGNTDVLAFTAQAAAVSNSIQEAVAAGEYGMHVTCVSQVIPAWR